MNDPRVVDANWVPAQDSKVIEVVSALYEKYPLRRNEAEILVEQSRRKDVRIRALETYLCDLEDVVRAARTYRYEREWEDAPLVKALAKIPVLSPRKVPK
jgi:hypothetical protein